MMIRMMRKFILASFFLVLSLAFLDAITTKIALARGCYEVNPFIRFLLGYDFVEIKLILTALTFSIMLVLLHDNDRVLKACCVTVITFYSLVVANNVAAIFGTFDFGFDMPKLTLLALCLFLLSLKAIPSSQRQL